MFRTIYWAYMTQFRHTKGLSLRFRIQHASKMGWSMYRMGRTHRNRAIKRQLKSQYMRAKR